MLPVLLAYGALWALLLAMIAWTLLAELGRRLESRRHGAAMANRVRASVARPPRMPTLRRRTAPTG